MKEAQDLIILFLNHKINKESLKKILRINKISFEDFNLRVKNLIKEFRMRKGNSLKLNTIIDDNFKKEIIEEKNKEAKPLQTSFLLDKHYDFDYVYRNSGFLTYKSAKRLLNVEELVCKAKEYLKVMNMDVEVQDKSIELISRSLEFFLKNIFDHCGENLDLENVKEIISKHMKVLNMFDLDQ